MGRGGVRGIGAVGLGENEGGGGEGGGGRRGAVGGNGCCYGRCRGARGARV
jgi:hypothetical protein